MSQYPQYVLPNENNQYNIVGFDGNNVFKSMMENSVDSLVQNFTTQNNTYFPQNKMPTNPYLLQVGSNYMPMQPQFMPIMSFPNGNFVYLNQQQPQFLPSPNNSIGSQFVNSPMMPMHLSPSVGPLKNPIEFSQVTTNESSKKPSLKTRKQSYTKHALKNEPVVIGGSGTGGDSGGGQHEGIPCDTKNRPLLFNCSACSKRFSTQARLDQHFLCHTGDRPYVCNICNFAFTQKSYLMRHTAVHREERSFECALCKKTYKHYGSLANHRKTHNKQSRKTPSNHNNLESSSSMIDINGVNHLHNSSFKTESDINNIIGTSSSFSSNHQNHDNDFIFHNGLQNNPSQQQTQIIKSEQFDNQYNRQDLSATTDLFSNSFQYQLVPSNLSTNSATNFSYIDHLNYVQNVQFCNSDSNVTNGQQLEDDDKINSLLSSLNPSSQPNACLSQSIIKTEEVKVDDDDDDVDDILSFAV